MRSKGRKVAVSAMAEAFAGGIGFFAHRIAGLRPEVFSCRPRNVPWGKARKRGEIRRSGASLEGGGADCAELRQSRVAAGKGRAENRGHGNGRQSLAGPRRRSL